MIIVKSKNRSKTSKWRSDTITIEGKHLFEIRVWPESFEYPTQADHERHLTLDIRCYHVLATNPKQARKLAREYWRLAVGDGKISCA